MTRPQTVVKDPYNPEVIILNSGVSGHPIAFTVHGQTPDRTYEDRDVYFAIDEQVMASIYADKAIRPDFNFYSHLRAEDAIQLGQALVAHGTRALMANMIQHQHIHHENNLKRFISEDRVEKIVFTMINDRPANHGDGWKVYSVKPVWNDGKAPEFQEDFEFETIVYWSPFEDEFKQQTGYWEVPIEFVGYDHEKEVAAFNKMVEEYEDGQPSMEESLQERIDNLSDSLGITIHHQADEKDK
jgi:hypothetical protein